MYGRSIDIMVNSDECGHNATLDAIRHSLVTSNYIVYVCAMN